MKCEYCGFENGQDFTFCPNCGASARSSAPAAAVVNTAAEKVLQALQDTLFLVLCILMSVSCALTLIQSGPDVLSILFTIFFWLIYAQSRKGIADAAHLRSVSGMVYAHYIIVNVVAILVIVVGAIVGLAFGALAGDPAFMNEFMSSLDSLPYDTAALVQSLASASGAVILFVFALIGGLMIVINMFSIRYIHRFAKSVYQSVETGTLALKHVKAAHGWLWAFGVISGISLLGDLGSGDLVLVLSSGASCAMPILAALLIKKHLMPKE